MTRVTFRSRRRLKFRSVTSTSISNASPIEMRPLRATKTARQPETRFHQTSPLIIGHRGASALAPENTLAAFARALDDGADGIELDVRLAKDGVPVVIHDATLRRTGLTSGEVAQMTSEQLANVNVGSWFNRAHPTLAREEYEQQRVPTLADVFQFSPRQTRHYLR